MHSVSFPSRNPLFLQHLTDETRSDATIDVEGLLFLPEGDADEKVPAVVIVEGLGGIIEEREIAYGRKLSGQGYVALAVDTFAPRGAEPLLHPHRAVKVTEAQMLADAFGALRFLAEHPRVDARRIFVMGFSYGGMITVLAAYEQIASLLAGSEGPRFAGHVSYYGCSVPRLEDVTTTGAPLLVMLGELDRNVDVERARHIAEDQRRGGSEVDLQVFEGIYHQWDGADRKKRFVPFALCDTRMTFGRDNVVRMEETGKAITNRAQRALAIARTSRPSGYRILRHDESEKRSDALLFAFLEKHGGKSVRAAGAAMQGDGAARRGEGASAPLSAVAAPA